MIDRQESAIVRQALKDMANEINFLAKKGIENFYKVGKILIECKEQIGHGNWTEWIEKNLGISPRQCRKYMALSKRNCGADLNSAWEEICNRVDTEENESPQQLTSNSMPETSSSSTYSTSSRQSTNGHQSRAERTGQTAPQSHPALANGVHRNGAPSTNGHAKLPPVQIMREPGDDTEAIEAEKKALREQPKNGSPIFDWKVIEEPYGKLVRSVDLLGNAFRCKESARLNAVREQLASAHSGLKTIYQHKGI